ncbi:PAS domain-containing protein [Streptomyces sp. 7-21]|uniref:PAS domain-containing protein n=1 Tax=Streptomyces sp. 7-21 TaxID=2802283 RepID=UPI00191D1010|nr:PAS domain-containing protein [Streptomyces sp. 7-21]MBL1065163.1 PAS domain-containing protein [Streptomyces sp. 7-21]
MADTERIGAELGGFRERVAELRAARALPTGDRAATLDSALMELEYVAGVLWPRLERLEAAHRSRSGPGPDGGRERQLLKTVFQRLPAAVVVTDAEGVVRRLNHAATRLLGLRAGYATGRPLSASFRHDARAVLRSHLAAVARGEGDRSLVAHLHQAGRTGVTLTAVRPSGERRSAVLCVLSATRAAVPAPRRPGPERRPDPPGDAARHTALLDLLDDLTTALLRGPGHGDGPVLARAAAVLAGRFADWVIADVTPPGGPARRALVLPPPGEESAAAAVAAQDPGRAPLIGEAAGTAACVLRVRPEDPGALGETGAGAPLLALVEGTSVLCVPLPAPAGSGGVLGVLTLVRAGDREPFALAEAAVMDRASRHLALALTAEEDGRHPAV